MTPGEQLRQAREAAGLSRDDVALGFDTAPVAVSAFSRAEWLKLIEEDVAPIAAEDLAQLAALIATLAGIFADRPPIAARSAA